MDDLVAFHRGYGGSLCDSVGHGDLSCEEVMDSEEDENDPFRDFRRAHTDPVAANKRSKLNRSHTAPAKASKSLLSVLLPDNVDTSLLDMDFTVLQSSTQLTRMTSVGSTADFLGRVIELVEDPLPTGASVQCGASNTTGVDDDSDVELLDESAFNFQKGLISIPLPATDNGGSDHSSETVSPENTELLYGIISRISGTSEMGNTKVDTTAAVATTIEPSRKHVPELPAEPTKRPTQTPSPPSRPRDEELTTEQTNDNIITNEPSSSVTRPVKRKPTLSELCALQGVKSYKVGLSRRVNVQHLHPSLKK